MILFSGGGLCDIQGSLFLLFNNDYLSMDRGILPICERHGIKHPFLFTALKSQVGVIQHLFPLDSSTPRRSQCRLKKTPFMSSFACHSNVPRASLNHPRLLSILSFDADPSWNAYRPHSRFAGLTKWSSGYDNI